MNSKKLIERLNELQKENRELKANCAIQEHVIKNRHNPMDIEKLQRLILENAELREEIKSKGKLISQQAKELERRHTLLQEQEVEMEQLSACAYYKAGGLCRYGGDDPANVCVQGPCPYQMSVWDVLDKLHSERDKHEKIKAERDSLRCFFEDISSKPDCNTCADKECMYRPRLGMTTRFNCPLWQGRESK